MHKDRDYYPYYKCMFTSLFYLFLLFPRFGTAIGNFSLSVGDYERCTLEIIDIEQVCI